MTKVRTPKEIQKLKDTYTCEQLCREFGASDTQGAFDIAVRAREWGFTDLFLQMMEQLRQRVRPGYEESIFKLRCMEMHLREYEDTPELLAGLTGDDDSVEKAA